MADDVSSIILMVMKLSFSMLKTSERDVQAVGSHHGLTQGAGGRNEQNRQLRLLLSC